MRNVMLKCSETTGALTAAHPLAKPHWPDLYEIIEVPDTVPLAGVVLLANQSALMREGDLPPVFRYADLARGAIVSPVQ